ncbi:MAG: hypothetical protein QNJ32_15495 [Xenococcaceae cyanobacterium MO_167.B27]|nr:hypothetical protein [Xenococcaceae cyanobacterium MO_167.B27]
MENKIKNNTKVIDLAIRLFILGLIAAWCFVLIRPFIAIILWAAVLAIGLFPIFLWLKARLGGKAKLTVIIISLIGIGITIGPVSFIATVLVSNRTLAKVFRGIIRDFVIFALGGFATQVGFNSTT